MKPEEVKKCLNTMDMVEDKYEKVSVKQVTNQYKKLAKERHQDKPGGNKDAFQELQGAFKAILAHLEEEGEVMTGEEAFFRTANTTTANKHASQGGGDPHLLGCSRVRNVAIEGL